MPLLPPLCPTLFRAIFLIKWHSGIYLPLYNNNKNNIIYIRSGKMMPPMPPMPPVTSCWFFIPTLTAIQEGGHGMIKELRREVDSYNIFRLS